MGGDLVLLELARVEPPLTHQGHHAHEHLGVHRGGLGVEVPCLELRRQQVLDLARDIRHDAGEGSGGMSSWTVPHQDSESVR